MDVWMVQSPAGAPAAHARGHQSLGNCSTCRHTSDLGTQTGGPADRPSAVIREESPSSVQTFQPGTGNSARPVPNNAPAFKKKSSAARSFSWLRNVV